MGDESTKWTVSVDSRTDIDLRAYLAQSGKKDGDLSEFIEEAVKWRLLDLTMADVRSGFSDMAEDDLAELVDAALSSARSH